MKELHELLEGVNDQATFLEFVGALAADRRRHAESWQNDSIHDFLESAVAWGRTTDMGATQGLADASAWKKAALFLYCGKIYE